MRNLVLLTLTVMATGCSHLRAPGEFETAPYRSPGSLRTPGLTGPATASGTAAVDQAEVEEPSFYTPSRRGQKREYRPKAAFSLTWPLNAVKINQPFRPMKKRRPHLGVDFAGKKGTPIFAAHEGLVIYAGRAFRGFGKMVIVEYDDQWASLYAHLDKIQVKQGQVVEQGQTLGTMGRTGRATGVHLHFELLHNQRPVDPVPLLNEYERLVETEQASNY